MRTLGAFILIGSVALAVWLGASVSPIDRAEFLTLLPFAAMAAQGYFMLTAEED